VELNKLRRKSDDKNKQREETANLKTAVTEEVSENVEQQQQQVQIHHEEEEVLRIMMNYGNFIVTAEGVDHENEKHFFELTLAEYACMELWRDELVFEDPIHQMVLDEFIHEITNSRIPLMDYFIRHTNPAISHFAINVAKINYNLSDKWNKFGVYVSEEKNEAKQALDHFINSLKEKKLTAHIQELKEELKHLPFEEAIKTQAEILRLEQSKKQLNQILGRIITK